MRILPSLMLDLMLIVLAAGCASAPAQTRLSQKMPAPVPRVIPAAIPTPISTPTPAASLVSPMIAAATASAQTVPGYRGDWRDWPITAGNWDYRQDARGSIALYGTPGADAELTIRCDRLAGRIFVSRKGAAPGNAPMIVRTSSLTRTVSTDPTGGTPAYMAAALMPSDALLDAIGFSRGRFTIEQATLPVLVIPAWAEILRVSEDCRR